MIYWNLRSTSGHAAQADTSNTMLLSGFSPSMLSLILKGQAIGEQEIIDENGVITKASVTPWDLMRAALDDENYNVIRSRLNDSIEGYLQHYQFQTPDEVDDDDIVIISSSG